MTVDELQLKTLVKEAVWELTQERREELSDFFGELIEDMALARAIREGEASESVSRDEVLALLNVLP
ncbi:hypothetical protein [Caldilinea sp.]|uniref:hypothetical protein n=1 Tax=Caldilinea sp. TaxID=2293560 RepID=UPI0021DDA52F|nr:hypothetical protein [Caldilinea sp.]GIV73958.1 MAG: hypothetical protein KatS3mg049_2514 [Caldilinea sp.]